MVGIVVVMHGQLGNDLLSTAQFIVGKVEGIVSVSVDSAARLDDTKNKIAQAIAQVNKGDGVLVLTDVFGGTPCNMCLPFLDKGKVDVLCGVNLPIFIKLATLRNTMGLSELALFIKSYGRLNISLASEIIGGKKNIHDRK